MIENRNLLNFPFGEYRQEIERIDAQYKIERGIRSKKPSVILLVVCTTEDPQDFEIPDRSGSIVYYRLGIGGILPGSGPFMRSRKM